VDPDDGVEPTDAEGRVAAVGLVVLTAAALATRVIGNTTGNWIPAWIVIAAALLAVPSMITWSARRRGQGWFVTARQTAKRVFSRRSVRTR
jgi:hypothetical protein